jgi:hypothetical protein
MRSVYSVITHSLVLEKAYRQTKEPPIFICIDGSIFKVNLIKGQVRVRAHMSEIHIVDYPLILVYGLVVRNPLERVKHLF